MDWNAAVKESFPNAENPPWITIPANGFYEGVITQIKPGMTKKFGDSVVEFIEIWFNENGKDRHFDANIKAAQQFQMLNAQVGDTVKISKTEEPAFDKAGNPKLTAEGKQIIYQNYFVDMIERSNNAAPATATAAKAADAGEISMDDIPF